MKIDEKIIRLVLLKNKEKKNGENHFRIKHSFRKV